MRLSFIIAAVLWLGGFADASAQNLAEQSAALKVIRDTAADICYTVEQKGQKSQTQLKGDVQAKVDGALAKIVGLGVQGSGEFTGQDYQGVTRDALASAIKSSTDCRLTVFNKLVEKMLSGTSATGPTGDNTPSTSASNKLGAALVAGAEDGFVFTLNQCERAQTAAVECSFSVLNQGADRGLGICLPCGGSYMID